MRRREPGTQDAAPSPSHPRRKSATAAHAGRHPPLTLPAHLPQPRVLPLPRTPSTSGATSRPRSFTRGFRDLPRGATTAFTTGTSSAEGTTRSGEGTRPGTAAANARTGPGIATGPNPTGPSPAVTTG